MFVNESMYIMQKWSPPPPLAVPSRDADRSLMFSLPLKLQYSCLGLFSSTI